MNPAIPNITPVRYQPSFEHAEKDEAKTARELVETMHKISVEVKEDEGRAYRNVHSKTASRARRGSTPACPAARGTRWLRIGRSGGNATRVVEPGSLDSLPG